MRNPTRRNAALLLLCLLWAGRSISAQVRIPGPGGSRPSGGGASSFAYISSSVTGCIALSANNCVYTTHTNPVAGHARVITTLWADTGAQTATPTSSNGDTWTPIGPGKVSGSNPGTTGFSFERFRVFSSVGGADTITLTISGSTGTFNAWETTEYSYTGTLSAVDGTPVLTNVTASASIATSASVTTSNSSDLLWADCPGTVGTCSVGSGWTARNDATGTCQWNGAACNVTNDNMNGVIGLLVEDKVGVAAGTYTATFGTTNSADAAIVGLVAF
jgi:hypothetical protein